MEINILSINIERSDQNNYCGILTYIKPNKEKGNILWTVELIKNTKVVVGFVQGDKDEWLDIVNKYANYLSDNIILLISQQKNSLSLKKV